MSERLNAATIIGGVLTVFGIAAVIASFQIRPDPDGNLGARIFPLVGAGSLVLLGAIEFLRGVRGIDTSPLTLGGQSSSVFILLLLSLVYIWGISKFGYLVSTGVVAPLALWLFGVRNPLGLIIAAIVCPAIYHFIFFVLLGVYPPYGEWFDLLDIIQGA